MIDPFFGAIGAGLLSAGSELASGLFNLNQGQKTLDYQKWAQQQTWNREDSAVQRRVADLQAAGLNPILAAGSAAQTGQPIRAEFPKFEGEPVGKGLQAAGLAVEMMRQKADIEKTQAETEYVKLQQKKLTAETIGQELGNEFSRVANPTKIELLRLDESLAREINPYKLQRAYEEMNIVDLEKTRRGLDNQLKELGIAPAKVQEFIAKEGISTSLAKFSRDKEEQELALKKVLVEQARHNLETYRKLGLPTGTGLNLQSVAVTKGGDIAGAISDALEGIFGRKRQ